MAYVDIYTKMTENLNVKPITIEMLIEKLLKDYGYKEEQFSKLVTKNLILSNTNVKLRPSKTQDINITLDNNLVTTYFALIKGKYYKINFEENNFTLGEAKNTLPDKEEIVTTVESGNNVITVGLEENKITITGKEGQTGKATIKVSYGALDKTIEVKVNDLIVDIGDVIEYLNNCNIWNNIANGVKTAIESKGVKFNEEVEAYGTPNLILLKKVFDKIYGEEKFDYKSFTKNEIYNDKVITATDYLYRLINDDICSGLLCYKSASKLIVELDLL